MIAIGEAPCTLYISACALVHTSIAVDTALPALPNELLLLAAASELDEEGKKFRTLCFSLLVVGGGVHSSVSLLGPLSLLL